MMQVDPHATPFSASSCRWQRLRKFIEFTPGGSIHGSLSVARISAEGECFAIADPDIDVVYQSAGSIGPGSRVVVNGYYVNYP